MRRKREKKIFMKYSELSRVFFLSRPVSLFALYEKMTEIEEKLSKKMKYLSLMMIPNSSFT